MPVLAELSGVERSTMRKIRRRLLFFVSLLYFIAFLDRANVAYGRLTMTLDLGFRSGSSARFRSFPSGCICLQLDRFIGEYFLTTVASPCLKICMTRISGAAIDEGIGPYPVPEPWFR
jgi:hypothetical protein